MSDPRLRDAARAAMILALFALLALPFRWFGKTRGQAQSLLEDLPFAPDIAVIGDSRPHVGIAPRLLLRDLQRAGLGALSGYNYAEDGTDALHHVDLIERDLLRLPRPPRVVLWAPNPLSFDASRKANRLERLPPTVIPPLVMAGAPAELLLDLGTMAVFSPYRHRPALKLRLEDLSESLADRLLRVQGLLGLTVRREPRGRIYTEHADGQSSFRVVADWEARFARGLASYRERYAQLQLDETHFKLAAHALRHARARGCLVILAEMPVSPTYRAELATTRQHLSYRVRLAALAQEEGALWLSFADRFDDDHAFGDPAHLVESSAAEFTAELAQVLLAQPQVRAALGAPAAAAAGAPSPSR